MVVGRLPSIRKHKGAYVISFYCYRTAVRKHKIQKKRLISFSGLVCSALLFFSTCQPSIPALWGLSQEAEK
jgi:hypothetical protein